MKKFSSLCASFSFSFKKVLMGSVYVICLITLVPGPENDRCKLQPLEKNYALLTAIISIGRCNVPFQPWCSFWRSVSEIMECSRNRSFYSKILRQYLGSSLLFLININNWNFCNSDFLKTMSSFPRKCEHNSIHFCHPNILMQQRKVYHC